MKYKKLRSKRDRIEARKFYEQCKYWHKNGDRINSAALRAWDRLGSPPLSYYPRPNLLKVYFY